VSRSEEFHREYAGGHQPPRDGAPLHDLTQSFPEDVYSTPHFYDHSGGRERYDRDSANVVRTAKGKPEKLVTVYRAAPASATHINPGDWVAVSPHYAKQHAAGGGTGTEPDWPIHSAKVPAAHVRSGGNDIVEYGFHGPTPVPVTTKHPPKRGWRV
jgi:hypothetical protein